MFQLQSGNYLNRTNGKYLNRTLLCMYLLCCLLYCGGLRVFRTLNTALFPTTKALSILLQAATTIIQLIATGSPEQFQVLPRRELECPSAPNCCH